MAKILDGNAIAQDLLSDVAKEIRQLQGKRANFKPTLAIIQVGERIHNHFPIDHIREKANDVGIEARLIKLNKDVTQSDLENEIDTLNNDSTVDGITCQLPLDCVNKIDSDSVLDRIDVSKDVDGLSRQHAGWLMNGELEKTVFPCAAYACWELVKRATSDPNYVKGKNVVVLGRSRIVGPPAAALFMWQQGTTSIGDSKSENLKDLCQKADILIVGLGEEHLVKGDWIKPGAVVIDCGINVKVFEEGKVQHGGDVDFEEAVKVAGYITPAPGGVGPMTVAMLMKNTLKQAVERGIQGGANQKTASQTLKQTIRSA